MGQKKISNWVKGEMLQKSWEAAELNTHSLVNIWSNSKKELCQKFMYGLNNTLSDIRSFPKIFAFLSFSIK